MEGPKNLEHRIDFIFQELGPMDTLVNVLLLVGILGVSAFITQWFTKRMYNRCSKCATLNARRRSECRSCGTLLLFLISILAGCSEQRDRLPGQPSQPASPPKPVTARFAFQRMAIQARTWAPDAQPLRVSSVRLKEVPSEAGKYPAWRATFVSAQLRKARTYSFSVVESPGDTHEGVLLGSEEAWSGPTGQAQPFSEQLLKVDSDEAYLAAARESRDHLKKHPNMPVNFLLEFTPRFPLPAWRVFWGETLGASDYSVFINCTTGKYLQTLH